MKNINNRALSWSAIDILVRSVLSFVVLIILARLLQPEDFGLLALLMLFTAVASLLIESGFSQALIQRRETTDVDESSIFFFTLMMGAMVGLALCVIAPWIASFYEQPVLESITYCMALNVFINSFSAIHTALLTKSLDFKTIAKAGAVSTTISGIIAVSMAFQGWGVWSLVAQVLATSSVSVLMLWILHPWRPRWVFSLSSLQSYFKFGGYLLWTGVLRAIYVNIYALLIGKLHSLQDVGFYSQAQRLQQLPVNILSNAVGRVAFSAFSKIKEDKLRLSRGLRKSLVSVMFINIPLMLMLFLLAEPLVLLLFGDKWHPIVPVLQVLSLVGLMWPLHAMNNNVLIAQGYAALNAKIQLLKLSVGIAVLIATSPFGILAIAYGQVAVSLFGFFVNVYYTKIHLDYGGGAQLRDIMPYFFAAAPMTLCIVFTQTLATSYLFQVLVGAVCGVVCYIAACKVAKLEGLDNLLSIIRKK